MGTLRVINGATEHSRMEDARQKVAASLAEVCAEVDELERQFVENDLTVTAGKRFGEPLTVKGRSQRFGRLRDRLREQMKLEQQLRDFYTYRDALEAEARRERMGLVATDDDRGA